ncbi:hypothetical protein [Neolewinella persica]|uniref:hypothetical protein n=1 Tax=Neolewinella persica TaxID=70998 RepID=UPI000382BBCE|nr:hypothetical protein [Neolewinella persica]
MKYFQHLLLTGLCITCCFSCSNQLEDLSRVDETRYNSAYAVPIIDSDVTLSELIGDVTENVSLSVDPDGLLRFRYSGEVPAVGSDVIFARLEALARGVFLPITRNRLAAPFGGADDVDIDELRIKGGLLTYALTNEYDRPVTVTLSLPDATLDGVAFSVSADLPAYSGTGDVPTFSNPDDPVNLKGYVLTIPNDSLYFEYDIVDEMGNDLTPSPGAIVAITNLRFSYMEGYLGQALYPGGRDTIEVDFFDNYLEGDIFFEDPTITMTLINTFGVPALAQVSVLNVIDVNGEVIPITGDAVDEGFYFEFPRTPGDTAFTTFVFDNTNSNIAEVLSARPVALDYEVDALVNPDADTDIIGFLTDSAAYQAKVEVELPLYGNASDFTVRDTFVIDLMDRYQDVVGIDFRLTTRNGLPLAIELQGTFLDDAGNALADLNDGAIQLLQAASVDALGNTTNTADETNDITFEDERLEAIRNAASLVITLDISTTNGGTSFVRVTDNQMLQVLLGAIVRVENR